MAKLKIGTKKMLHLQEDLSIMGMLDVPTKEIQLFENNTKTLMHFFLIYTQRFFCHNIIF